MAAIMRNAHKNRLTAQYWPQIIGLDTITNTLCRMVPVVSDASTLKKLAIRVITVTSSDAAARFRSNASVRRSCVLEARYSSKQDAPQGVENCLVHGTLLWIYEISLFYPICPRLARDNLAFAGSNHTGSPVTGNDPVQDIRIFLPPGFLPAEAASHFREYFPLPYLALLLLS